MDEQVRMEQLEREARVERRLQITGGRDDAKACDEQRRAQALAPARAQRGRGAQERADFAAMGFHAHELVSEEALELIVHVELDRAEERQERIRRNGLGLTFALAAAPSGTL